MTIQDYIRREIVIWGEDYVFDLLDKGYEVVLTNHGFRWVMPGNSAKSGLTTGRESATVSSARS